MKVAEEIGTEQQKRARKAKGGQTATAIAVSEISEEEGRAVSLIYSLHYTKHPLPENVDGRLLILT